ncbi:MAG: hypothetical protein AAF318_09850 [Pseudomonadota bacterium]
MTDFYSVLQRAVATLPDGSGPNRRAVYDKARKALLKQLQSFDPPLPSSDVTAQRLALEDAIRKIENEIARQIRTQRALQTAATPLKPGPRPATPAEPDEDDIVRRKAEADRARKQNAALLAAAVSEATTAEPEPVNAPPVPVPVPVQQPADPYYDTRDDSRMFEDDGYDQDEPAQDDGIVDGEYDEVLDGHDDDDLYDEPVVDPREEKRRQKEERRAQKEEEKRLRAERRSKSKTPKTRERRQPSVGAAVDGPTEAPRRRAKQSRAGGLSRVILPVVLLGLLAGAAYAAYTQREALLSVLEEFQGEDQRPPITVTGRSSPAKNEDRLGATLDGEDTRTVATTRVGPDLSAPATAPTDTEPTVAPPPARTVEPETAPTTPVETATAPPVEAPATTPATPITEFTASGTQTAVLYEEAATAGGAGGAVSGGVEWSMVRQSIGGSDPEPVIRATASIPERNMTTTITVRENSDSALPASHLIEIAFNLPEGFEGGGVKNVPGVIMKESEQSRGDALRGAAARVSSGLFWIALSENPQDRDNNLKLLRERDWIDIPILYESGRRAILTLRKGSDGLQSVNAAIDAWSPG